MLTDHRKKVLAALHQGTVDTSHIAARGAIRWLLQNGFINEHENTLTALGFDALGLNKPTKPKKPKLSDDLPQGATLVSSGDGTKLGFYTTEPDEYVGTIYKKWVYIAAKPPVSIGFSMDLKTTEKSILTNYNRLNSSTLTISTKSWVKGGRYHYKAKPVQKKPSKLEGRTARY